MARPKAMHFIDTDSNEATYELILSPAQVLPEI
jgi:hypothetical protein